MIRQLVDMNNGSCQGHQFPVLQSQYLGIRSDTCRFGYASTPSDPVLATTWVSRVLNWEKLTILKAKF